MAKIAKPKATPLPANLSYLRSIEPTDGVMYSVAVKSTSFGGLAAVLENKKDDESFVVTPVRVTETTARGTISFDDKVIPESRINQGEKSLDNANLALIEQARLDADAEYLLVRSSVRFAGHATDPGMCSEPEFAAEVAEFLAAYKGAKGFEELALRYVLNLATGSWLWRNQFGDGLQVSLSIAGTSVIVYEEDVDVSKGFTLMAIADGEVRNKVAKIVERVADALGGGKKVRVTVVALINLGASAEVYPSQEKESVGIVRVARNPEKVKTEKILAKGQMSDGSYVAVMHARKIGNAIRRIDTWHGVENVGAIAVEVYGANTHKSQAYRAYGGKDLFSSLKSPKALQDSLVASGLNGTHHFVVACLIRGGVFGFASASKKNKTAEGDTPAAGPSEPAEGATVAPAEEAQ